MSEIRTIRDPQIDIIKGLGIICIVAGHCNAPFTDYLYLFHVAVFFISSGYCYKDKSTESFSELKRFISRKVVTLYLPYVFWISVFSMMHNLFIHLNIYTDSPLIKAYLSGNYIGTTTYWTCYDIFLNIGKSFLLVGGVQVLGAFWFISTLFIVLVFYGISDYVLKGIRSSSFSFQTVLSVLYLIIGFTIKIILPNTLGSLVGRVLTGYCLLHLGVVLKKYKRFLFDYDNKSIHFITFCLSIMILLICKRIGNVELGQNEYHDPVFLLVSSIAGWFLLYELSNFFMCFPKINNTLVIIGQSTMSVLIFHFLCFKIINYIGIIFLYPPPKPLFLIAAFPVLFVGRLWWIAYLLIGTVLPIYMNIIYKKIKKMLFVYRV